MVLLIFFYLEIYYFFYIIAFINKQNIVFATFDSIGTCLLLLIVFPKLDLVRSLLLINTISFVPSTLKLINELTNPHFRTRSYRSINDFLNLLACLMQHSVLLIIPFDENSFNQENSWILPLLLCLISISFAREFLYVNLVNLCKKTKINNEHLLKSLESIRHNQLKYNKLGLIVNTWKIGITVLIYHLNNQEFLNFFNKFWSTNNSSSIYLETFLVQISSLLIFYFSCSLAFKLGMHRIAFTLPLMFITPVLVLMAVLFCDQSVKGTSLIYFKDYYMCTSSSFTKDPLR